MNYKLRTTLLTVIFLLAILPVKPQTSTNTGRVSGQKIIHSWQASGNPIITHKYTCDPAALVYNYTLYIFTGEDATGGLKEYNIKNWCCFATTDMKNFIEYKTPLYASDFSWNTGNYAYAAQVIERNGKFYWYVSTNATGIGVAVSDSGYNGSICATVSGLSVPVISV